MEICPGDGCKLQGPELDISLANFLRNVGNVSEIAEEVVDMPDFQLSLQVKSENRGRKVLSFFDAQVRIDSLDRGLGGVVSASVGFHLMRV